MRAFLLITALFLPLVWCEINSRALDLSKIPIVGNVPTLSTRQSGSTPGQTPGEIYAFNTCVGNCPSTQEYNPVCGSDGATYYNMGKLRCANRCGRTVTLVGDGWCGVAGG